jgi:hypothetical protein
MLPFVSQNVYRKAPGPALLLAGTRVSRQRKKKKKKKKTTLYRQRRPLFCMKNKMINTTRYSFHIHHTRWRGRGICIVIAYIMNARKRSSLRFGLRAISPAFLWSSYSSSRMWFLGSSRHVTHTHSCGGACINKKFSFFIFCSPRQKSKRIRWQWGWVEPLRLIPLLLGTVYSPRWQTSQKTSLYWGEPREREKKIVSTRTYKQ